MLGGDPGAGNTMRYFACICLTALLCSAAACTPTSPRAGGLSNANANDNSGDDDNRNDNRDDGVSNANDNADTGGDNNNENENCAGSEIEIPNEGAAHVESGTQVTYQANPPASGPHWPSPAAPGFYEAALDEEEWVHNLEHGYAVILFDCRGECDPELLDALRELADTAPPSSIFMYAKIVVTSYDGLPEGVLITAAAWDVQMHLSCYDEAALLDFYNRHLDQGPEDAG